ncbi:MAG: acetaldehyde dehydrogenase (acetylating) [Fimbriimonadaceae bacterium]
MGRSEKLTVAILGSGNIGTDLLIKCLRSAVLEPVLFIGRNLNSAGMAKANSLGVRISDRSIDAILDAPDICDLVFDATTAQDHLRHAPLLEALGKVVIDMTPAKLGTICVPAVNLDEARGARNVNMVTCGGQASIPIAHMIAAVTPEVDYIEVVSSIASRSAGPATRLNLDEYIDTTEQALIHFTACRRAKAILILNPATPCIDMQTTIFANVKDPDLELIRKRALKVVTEIQSYVPGYELLVPPQYENGRLVITVKCRGLGDYLPGYAGNLDIINCAAVAAAESFAGARRENVVRA